MTAPQPTSYAHADYAFYREQQDASHLRILAICHYVWGGLLAVFSLVPLIHIGLGIAMISGAFAQGPDSPPPELGWIFVFVGVLAIVVGETVAILNLISARMISRRRGRTLSLIMAGVNCLSIPLGTLLGVFTFIVLLRESVRAKYEEQAAPTAALHSAWR